MALSAYERKARLTPGLLGVAPITIAVATLGLKTYPAISLTLSALSATAGGYLLSVVVGNAGRGVQSGMYERWGGRPTTQLLRLREEASNPKQREIWRQAIEAATEVKLLSKRRETANAAMADNTIEAATDQVRYLGQDSRFPILASENAAYGFERNMWGFRWAGRCVALASLLLIASFLFLAKHTAVHVSLRTAIIGGVCNSLILISWYILPSEKRAKDAGFRYAHQLLNTVVETNRTESANTATDHSEKRTKAQDGTQ